MAANKEPVTGAGPFNGVLNWVDQRFPLMALWNDHAAKYSAPKNFNFWYIFGSIAAVVLGIQIITGIFLVMHYKPDAAKAFESVEYIMRDVPFGWLVRYMHSTGASAFFIVVYLHMFRGLLYGSYRKPRELVWIFGCLIFLCLMGEAFFGYLLPWGQMSYWGAQVIVNLFAAIPLIGPDLALLIRGDYVIGDATLNRFFAFHVIAIPFVLVGLVAAHIMALHEVGSNNPDGVEIKATKDPKTGVPLDGIPFHPYYTVHDIFVVMIFLILFAAVMFFAPEFGGYFLEYNNFIPANPLQTPSHIAPVWYFTPFYSVLRATTDNFLQYWLSPALLVLLGLIWLSARSAMARIIGTVVIIGMVVAFWTKLFDAKFWGVVAMGASVMIFFALPWIDRSPVKSMRYRPGWHFWLLIAFVVVFLILGYLGVQAPSDFRNLLAQIGTLLYFAFFLLMPWWSEMGTFRKPPARITFTPH